VLYSQRKVFVHPQKKTRLEAVFGCVIRRHHRTAQPLVLCREFIVKRQILFGVY